ncbi:MAG: sensor histidine kinase [Methanoregula sp.]|nr:sensor histidine kinase [Methanoregula sp.]
MEQSIRIAVSLVSPKEEISIESALHGLELYSDPLIEKIFANLIENAALHGKTTRRITFSCEETPEGLILTCEDDGVGISPKDKAHLFDRLVGEKIRFGLFFVQECILLSGMTIAETGKPGKGARFEITVPKGMYRVERPTT